MKSDWGHSTVEYAVNVAERAGVGTLALFHHDPAHSDDFVDSLASEAAAGVPPRGRSRSSPRGRACASVIEPPEDRDRPAPPIERVAARPHPAR